MTIMDIVGWTVMLIGFGVMIIIGLVIALVIISIIRGLLRGFND